MKIIRLQLLLLFAMFLTSCGQSTKSERNNTSDEVAANVTEEITDIKPVGGIKYALN